MKSSRASSTSKKSQQRFECSSCGAVQSKWLGQCPECGDWNTLEMHKARATGKPSAEVPQPVGWLGPTDGPSRLSDVRMDSLQRIPLADSKEINRVLGGGLVPGSLTLIGGDPGVGKSTLVMQIAHRLAQETVAGAKRGEDAAPVLYVSGEETAGQLKMRAQRLGVSDPDVADTILLCNESRVEAILEHVSCLVPRPRAVIVDSIQTVFSEQLGSAMGSVAQVRECAAYLLRMAKSMAIPTILVGHVTKTGKYPANSCCRPSGSV